MVFIDWGYWSRRHIHAVYVPFNAAYSTMKKFINSHFKYHYKTDTVPQDKIRSEKLKIYTFQAPTSHEPILIAKF